MIHSKKVGFVLFTNQEELPFYKTTTTEQCQSDLRYITAVVSAYSPKTHGQVKQAASEATRPC